MRSTTSLLNKYRTCHRLLYDKKFPFSSNENTILRLRCKSFSTVPLRNDHARYDDVSPLCENKKRVNCDETSQLPLNGCKKLNLNNDKLPSSPEPLHEAEIESKNPKFITYPDDVTLPLTSILKIRCPEDDSPIEAVMPVFRLMDEDGTLRSSHHSERQNKHYNNDAPVDSSLVKLHTKYQHNPTFLHELETNPLFNSLTTLQDAHRCMIRLRQMDSILQNAQRQGRISFYMSCQGEEAIHIGSASSLTLQDTIYAQYREAGVLMWRGFTLDQFTDQCFSNDKDLGRGRQMPVHYGSKALNYHTISSPLGTQVIQAVGAGYHMKMEAKRMCQQLKSCAVVFFGDGCASTSDFHAGCNFAATLECPVIFIVRNNGFAISTPVREQYRGDGIIGRAPGYGMASLRVDGNDIFAMSAAVKKAREYVLDNCKPILIEAMTYRQSHHSTSDDSTRYRSAKDIEEWATLKDPLKRLDLFLENEDFLHKNQRKEIADEERLNVLKAMERSEKRDKPHLDTMFQDVYCDVPTHLQRQEIDLKKHLETYGKEYEGSGH